MLIFIKPGIKKYCSHAINILLLLDIHKVHVFSTAQQLLPQLCLCACQNHTNTYDQPRQLLHHLIRNKIIGSEIDNSSAMLRDLLYMYYIRYVHSLSCGVCTYTNVWCCMHVQCSLTVLYHTLQILHESMLILCDMLPYQHCNGMKDHASICYHANIVLFA